MNMADTDVLPVIDMAKAKDPAQRLEVAKQLVQALETVGFLYIDNVDGFEPQTMQDIARWFFGQPDALKQEVSKKVWNPQSKNHYRGYFPLQPGESSYKEGFEIGQEIPDDVQGQQDVATHPTPHPIFTESNPWPHAAEGAEKFRSEMLSYFDAMLKCSAEILRLASLGCGLGEDWFQSMFFPASLSTLRLLHYPPRPGVVPEAARDGDTALCCSDHTDSGFVTLLATFNYKGLQIRWEDGHWMDVPCRPNSLVMNIGDMLSTMSGGRFKATRHRVVDTGVDRFSIPFFFEPNYQANIACVMPSQEKTGVPNAALEEGETGKVHYGPWVVEKMKQFAEYRELMDMVAHEVRA